MNNEINEMVKVIEETRKDYTREMKHWRHSNRPYKGLNYTLATALDKAGYRKQSDTVKEPCEVCSNAGLYDNNQEIKAWLYGEFLDEPLRPKHKIRVEVKYCPNCGRNLAAEYGRMADLTCPQ